ncbi:hypothetical protein BDA99DRAFT_492685 [Phascolomyces articulosus]|uniref:UBX domain-containing protein n=1 Tax=Phascolomyces articulosus TaxID=60185 RepID=A0AAD5KCV5_9FUNG|nr:hypothetical protein BDA99DRAFT_492685 [Phascolomyces articulosus]
MWFNGPVTEAVSLVNTKNCVFIVYIFDDSENSQKLDATLDSDNVVQKITTDAVALKMHKDSDNAKLFQQLYPMPHVPILYFISQGTIKEFGTQDTSEEEIIAKIDKTTSQQLTSSSSSPVPSNITPSPVPSTTPPSTTPSTSQPANVASSPSASSSPDALAKKEKLRKQMEEARKKREEKEKQNAREREIKRREDGKMMQQTKQQMEDERNKQHFAKIKKEKKEEEEHRRKIKEQIARDRAEQIAARQAAKKRQSENVLPLPQRKSSSGQHDSSSISIRQLDGSSIRNKFQATDTLSAVKDWIDQNRSDGDQPYKLLAQFPTRQFSIGDEQKSLKELELCPSATLIMKGIKNVSHAYGGNNGSYMDYVYSAGGMLYNAASTVGSTMSGVVYSLFPAEPAVAAGTYSGQNVVGGYPGNNNNEASGSTSPSTTNPSSTSFGGQRLGGESSRASPRSSGSNVNTLRTSEFDDDEDGRTYNGNSLNQE